MTLAPLPAPLAFCAGSAFSLACLLLLGMRTRPVTFLARLGRFAPLARWERVPVTRSARLVHRVALSIPHCKEIP